MLESFGAIATVALAIVGLSGIWPTLMAAIATIIVGAAVLMEAGAWGAKYTRENARFALDESTLGMDMLGGVAAVILGILALLGVAPVTLVAIAVLTLGACLLFSGRFLGVAAAVLGILAVCGLASAVLYLVGLLVLGAVMLLSGSELAARSLTRES